MFQKNNKWTENKAIKETKWKCDINQTLELKSNKFLQKKINDKICMNKSIINTQKVNFT